MENLPAKQEKNGPGSIALNDKGILSPTNFGEMWDVAVLFAKSRMMPEAYNDNPEGIMVAGQFGAQLGLTLMASIQNIAVVKGHPTVYGDSQLALVEDSKTLEVFVEYFDGDDPESDSFKAVCIAKRKGRGFEYNPEDSLNDMRKKQLYVNEFSVGDAKRAGVWGGTGSTPEKKKFSVWYKHPKRMLKMRARAFTLRDGWPDILKGMHSTEEMMGEEVVTLKQNDLGGYEPEEGSGETVDVELKNRDTSLYTTKTSEPEAQPTEPPPEETPTQETQPAEELPEEKPQESNTTTFQQSGNRDSEPPAWDENHPWWRDKWIKLKAAGYSAFAHENLYWLRFAPEKIQKEAVGKYKSIYPDETFPAVLSWMEKEKQPDPKTDEKQGNSTREKFFQAIEERGVGDDELEKVNECLQWHADKTGKSHRDQMIVAMENIAAWVSFFRSWKKPDELENPEREKLVAQVLGLKEKDEKGWGKARTEAGILAMNPHGMADEQLQALIDKYEANNVNPEIGEAKTEDPENDPFNGGF